MSPSDQIRTLYVREFNNLPEGVTRYFEINAEHRVGVGISKSLRYPFLLVLPVGSIETPFSSEEVEAIPVAYKEIESIQSGAKSEITASILSFRSLSKAAEIFIDVIVGSVLDAPDVGSVARLVSEFIDLFSKKSTLSDEEIIGFFGELTVIACSEDVDSMVESWHTNMLDRFDFSSGSDRLEVKIASTPRRIHRFSSRQLPSPSGVVVHVASMLTQQVPAGLNVFEMYKRIRDRSGEKARRELDLKFSRFVAIDESKCEDLSFDFEMAKKSLAIFDADSIPRPVLGPGVVSAKWESDLTHLEATRSKNTLTKNLRCQD